MFANCNLETKAGDEVLASSEGDGPRLAVSETNCSPSFTDKFPLIPSMRETLFLPSRSPSTFLHNPSDP